MPVSCHSAARQLAEAHWLQAARPARRSPGGGAVRLAPAPSPRVPARRLPDVPRQLPDAGPPANSTHVYFKDVIIAASDDSEDESEPASEREEAGEGGMRRRVSRRRKLRIDRQKLIIILVGLPGRGKTFLCNKLMCYLNWCAAAAAAEANTASLCAGASAAGWLRRLLVSACAGNRKGEEHTLMQARTATMPHAAHASGGHACRPKALCLPMHTAGARTDASARRAAVAGWATTRATSTWGSTAGSRRARPTSRTPPSSTTTTRFVRGVVAGLRRVISPCPRAGREPKHVSRTSTCCVCCVPCAVAVRVRAR